MDRTDKRIRILAHTIELIILPALNKKKMKIIAKAAAANKVLEIQIMKRVKIKRLKNI
ncbi:hypothetical protein P4T74_00495 [Bacillus mycoides]|uniref:hypothetical protein n=1 Tax=Bacillus mycoides TaxID=1405 RepID=UPI002E1F47F6|nr:hypothetical protein [Bacillus mycoides]